MSALAAARTNLTNKGSNIGTAIGYKAAASQTFYHGALVGLNSAGYLVPAAATAGLRIKGICDLQGQSSVVSSATLGATVISVLGGIFPFASGTSTDALTIADLGNLVYALDDQTVGRLPTAGRSVAGVLEKVDGANFYVFVGPMAPRAAIKGAGTAYQGDGSTAALASPGAIDVTANVTLLTTDGTDAITMPDGLFKGQVLIVTLVAGTNTPIGTITPATPSGFATVTAFGAVGDSAMFIWTGAAWVLGPTFGVTFT